MLAVAENNLPKGIEKYLSLAEKGGEVRFKTVDNLFFKIVPVLQEPIEGKSQLQ